MAGTADLTAPCQAWLLNANKNKDWKGKRSLESQQPTMARESEQRCVWVRLAGGPESRRPGAGPSLQNLVLHIRYLVIESGCDWAPEMEMNIVKRI